MNEREVIFTVGSIFIMAIIFMFCAGFCTGCKSFTKQYDGDVLSYQREITRLESAVQQYDTAMRNATERLGDITNRSRDMEGTVDEVIKLFDEYQRTVDQFIQDYNRIRTETKNTEKNTISINPSVFDSVSL